LRLAFIPLIGFAYVLAEIAALILVGDQIGVLPTLGLILLTSFVGVLLMRSQGLATFNRIRMESAQGRVPGRELVHGFMILFAGLLLLLPGFLTDVFGLLLFLPPVREAVWRFLRSRMTIVTSREGFSMRTGRPRQGVVDLDEGEFRRTSEPDTPDERLIRRD
jgi:UPF0716 protein FxsA